MKNNNLGSMTKRKAPKGTLRRLIKMLFGFYPVLVPLTILCILFAAAAAAIPDIFIQKITAIIDVAIKGGLDWESQKHDIYSLIFILGSFYFVSIAAVTLYCQLMAKITQGFLYKLRRKMFDGMQNLPIKYFDTNKHGDIMSYYTNDIDALRELISSSFPSLIRAGTILTAVFFIMLWYSVWMTLIVIMGIVVITLVTKKVGGGSAKYFVKAQRMMGDVEGYVQEMMNGQKVIKVFNRENAVEQGFDDINNRFYENSKQANSYANMLGPIIMNIGNVLYVLAAVGGGLMLLLGANNISISGEAFGISIVVVFLNMTKQFTGNFNQVSQQLNSVVMAMAGANRIFELMDAKPESDDGKVTLVNVKEEGGKLVEVNERTEKWAWKRVDENGEITYVRLRGDVRLYDVDFEYEEGKQVLFDVSVYAKPGQKVAFVGATGAGKTTITNLINRFYDIADGKITYDGIPINEIRKQHLRAVSASFHPTAQL